MYQKILSIADFTFSCAKYYLGNKSDIEDRQVYHKDIEPLKKLNTIKSYLLSPSEYNNSGLLGVHSFQLRRDERKVVCKQGTVGIGRN